MNLRRTADRTLKADLMPWSDGVLVHKTGPFTTPWRTVLISDSPMGLADSRIELNLNEPNRLADTSWIKIGKSSGGKPASVTGALHTLQQEGRAIRVRGMGPSRGSVWASPEAAARRDGIDRMHELHKARGLVAGEIDWRPTETMPEDYYAL
jgi:hypothetical protein